MENLKTNVNIDVYTIPKATHVFTEVLFIMLRCCENLRGHLRKNKLKTSSRFVDDIKLFYATKLKWFSDEPEFQQNLTK